MYFFFFSSSFFFSPSSTFAELPVGSVVSVVLDEERQAVNLTQTFRWRAWHYSRQTTKWKWLWLKRNYHCFINININIYDFIIMIVYQTFISFYYFMHLLVVRLSPLSLQQCPCSQVILPCLVQLEFLRPEKTRHKRSAENAVLIVLQEVRMNDSLTVFISHQMNCQQNILAILWWLLVLISVTMTTITWLLNLFTFLTLPVKSHLFSGLLLQSSLWFKDQMHVKISIFCWPYWSWKQPMDDFSCRAIEVTFR